MWRFHPTPFSKTTSGYTQCLARHIAHREDRTGSLVTLTGSLWSMPSCRRTQPTCSRRRQPSSSKLIKEEPWTGASLQEMESVRPWSPSNQVNDSYPCWLTTSWCCTYPPLPPLIAPPSLQHHHQKRKGRGT